MYNIVGWKYAKCISLVKILYNIRVWCLIKRNGLLLFYYCAPLHTAYYNDRCIIICCDIPTKSYSIILRSNTFYLDTSIVLKIRFIQTSAFTRHVAQQYFQ